MALVSIRGFHKLQSQVEDKLTVILTKIAQHSTTSSQAQHSTTSLQAQYSMGVDKGVLEGAQAPPNFLTNGVLIKRGGMLNIRKWVI